MEKANFSKKKEKISKVSNVKNLTKHFENLLVETQNNGVTEEKRQGDRVFRRNIQKRHQAGDQDFHNCNVGR